MNQFECRDIKNHSFSTDGKFIFEQTGGTSTDIGFVAMDKDEFGVIMYALCGQFKYRKFVPSHACITDQDIWLTIDGHFGGGRCKFVPNYTSSDNYEKLFNYFAQYLIRVKGT